MLTYHKINHGGRGKYIQFAYFKMTSPVLRMIRDPIYLPGAGAGAVASLRCCIQEVLTI